MESSAGVWANGGAEPVLPAGGPPIGYRLLLPVLPANKGMKVCVVLHGDLDTRPYGIEDFRAPLEELGVIEAVSGATALPNEPRVAGEVKASRGGAREERGTQSKGALLRSDRSCKARGDLKPALGVV